MFEAVWLALGAVLTPINVLMLLGGCVIGLALGAIPGLGGGVGMAIMLPFVMFLPADQAVILMIGLVAVTSTSDTVPSVLIGVPGTGGSQATIVDGHPLAKRGEGGRALGAAYTASLIGGLIGALVLILSIPVLRPLVLAMGTPELFMVALLGISLLGILTGNAPFIGLALGALGVLTSQIGIDPQSGVHTWTFGQPYLVDGLPFIPAILALFAVPAMLDLIGRGEGSISDPSKTGRSRGDVIRGMAEALKHWFIIVRCSLVGVLVGIMPGMGGAVTDWIAYAHVKQTVKRDRHLFGTGDIRGVIGPESANNAKDGGALIPTISFGIPGSSTYVLVLAALVAVGVRPGPEMLTTFLPLTFTMILTLILTNVLAVAIMLNVTPLMVRLCFIPSQILVPVVIVFIFMAAFQATIHIGDIIMLLVFSLIGWYLKKMDWPPAPLALGLILGPIIDRYLFVAYQIYGFGFFTRPGVLIIAALIVAGLAYAALTGKGSSTSAKPSGEEVSSRARGIAGALVVVAVLLYVVIASADWPIASVRLFVQGVAIVGLTFALVQVGLEGVEMRKARQGAAEAELSANGPRVGISPMTKEESKFFVWIFLYFLCTWMLGMVIGSTLFLLSYLLIGSRQGWRVAVSVSGAVTVFIGGFLDRILGLSIYRGWVSDWVFFHWF